MSKKQHTEERIIVDLEQLWSGNRTAPTTTTH
jgi:hypothetical protein